MIVIGRKKKRSAMMSGLGALPIDETSLRTE